MSKKLNKVCKYLDDIPRDFKYFKYMSKRYGLEDNIEYLNDTFWKYWKINILKKTKKYEDDSYKFMCIKTDYHKKN
tara:strand:- start:1435 stop:1662 length:228 start_codon:yes stop_codon:yes gene_type:complete